MRFVTIEEDSHGRNNLGRWNTGKQLYTGTFERTWGWGGGGEVLCAEGYCVA